MRNKSLVLCEDGAEEGNIEIGGTGFPRKPESANLCERLFFISQTPESDIEPFIMISDYGGY